MFIFKSCSGTSETALLLNSSMIDHHFCGALPYLSRTSIIVIEEFVCLYQISDFPFGINHFFFKAST